jgi:hypothetical protein
MQAIGGFTLKKCAFCGSISNVNYIDPEKGPVCQNCWLNLGQELEDLEEEKAKKESPERKKKDQNR